MLDDFLLNFIVLYRIVTYQDFEKFQELRLLSMYFY